MEQFTSESKELSVDGQRPEIDELINQVVSRSSLINLTKEDFNYLYKAKSVVMRLIYSFPKINESRMDSVIRECIGCSSLDYSKYHKIVFFIETSEEHPLLLEELNGIEKIVGLFHQECVVKWGLGRNNHIGDKVLFMLICSN